MLGPSFSPSIARIPGPTSSHSRCQRLPRLRAWWTRERSRDRAVSSGGQRRQRRGERSPRHRARSGARDRWRPPSKARRASRRPASRRSRARRRRSGRTAARRTAGCRRTSSSSPGAIPRSASYRSISGSESETRTNVPRAPAPSYCRLTVAPSSIVELARSGSGRRAGRRSGRRAWRRSAPRAPRRARARAPPPPGARDPTGIPSASTRTARAAGGGASPQARPAGRRRSARPRGTGACSTSPSSPSRLTIPRRDAGVTPSRSASALVVTGSEARGSSA